MNIIIEGIDNVGKTTLIRNIKNHFNDITFSTFHYSNVKQNNNQKVIDYSTKLYTEMFEFFDYVSEKESSGIICDRSHIGEMIYGPIYRNYPGDYVIDIEKKFHNYKFWDDLILILLTDDAKNVILRDDGLSFTTDLNKKTNEIELFNEAFDKSTIKNKLSINIKNFDEEEVKNIVIDNINEIIHEL